MSKGLGRNKQGDDHDKIGTDVPRAGLKTAAVKIPGSDAPPWKPAPADGPKPPMPYMNKGGPVKKKRKGYKHGGMVSSAGDVRRAGLK